MFRFFFVSNCESKLAWSQSDFKNIFFLRSPVYQIHSNFLKFYLLNLLLISVAAHSFAQDKPSKVDSLRSLANELEGLDKFDPLYELGFEFYGAGNLTEAVKVFKDAEAVATSFGDTLRMVKSKRVKGQVLLQLDNPSEAINIFDGIINTVRRRSFSDPLYFKEYKQILNSTAIAYAVQANYDKALQFHFESLLAREKDGDKPEISTTLNNIGFVYFKLKNYEKALEYYNRALALKNEANDLGFKDRLLINIGLCYNQIKEFEKAQEYINQGLKTCEPNCKEQTILEGAFGLGVSFYGQDKLEEAENQFNSSLKIAQNLNDKRFQLENIVYLARVNTKLNNENTAVDYLKKAESVALNTEYNQLLIDIYKEFANNYNQLQDFQNASLYQDKYIHLKDSIYSEGLIKNIARIQTDFAERENIKTIASNNVVIRQQRDLNIAIAIIAILAGLLILVLQRSNRISKQVNAQLSEAKETIQQQNKLLEIKNKDLDREVEKKTIDLEKVNLSLKQVNDELDNFIYKTSHDIRGPLASLKGMCNVALMDVQDAVALEYLKKLDTTAERLNSILTRLLIINQINNSKLSLSKIEFHKVIHDILLLEKKKGLPNKIHIRKFIADPASINVQSDKELVRIVLENLIDNAIKFYNDSERVESFVEIHIGPAEEEGYVRARIIDNGIGISESNPGKLFQMFFRASERSEIGGIGLYIVKTATAKIGGKVGLLTTPQGFTEFYVIFPPTPPDPEQWPGKKEPLTMKV
jgi:signal transduction histidine kinase